MKIAKEVFGIVLIMLLSATVAFSQAGPPKKHNSEKLIEQLDLSEDQLNTIKELKENTRAQAKEIFEDDSMDRLEKRIALQELRMSNKDKFESILSSEQLNDLSELREAKKTEKSERMESLKERAASIDKDALKAEIKDYKQTNVLPVLEEQRSKLEDEIVEADKVSIDKLRIDFQQFKEALKSKKEGFKESGEKPSPEKRLEFLKEVQAMEKPDMDLAKELVSRYDSEITSLLDEIKPQREKWRTEIKEIKQKYVPSDMMEKRKGHGHSKRMKGKLTSPEDRVEKHKLRFLLLDAGSKRANLEPGKASTVTDIKVFPNPSNTTNTLEYQTLEDGEVRIDLFDSQGKLVKSVVDGFRYKGNHSTEVQLSGLSGQLYYYVITDKNGTVTKKFVKTD